MSNARFVSVPPDVPTSADLLTQIHFRGFQYSWRPSSLSIGNYLEISVKANANFESAMETPAF